MLVQFSIHVTTMKAIATTTGSVMEPWGVDKTIVLKIQTMAPIAVMIIVDNFLTWPMEFLITAMDKSQTYPPILYCKIPI